MPSFNRKCGQQMGFGIRFVFIKLIASKILPNDKLQLIILSYQLFLATKKLQTAEEDKLQLPKIKKSEIS